MSRSLLVTERCSGAGGCGRWLVKYDPATKQIVEVAKRVKSPPRAHWEGPIDYTPGAGGFANPSPVWEYDPSMKSLVDKGIMINPDLETDEHARHRPPDYYAVRCSCGRGYKITL